MTPDEFTNQEFFLNVGDSHQLYVHDWGNPKAKTPIIFLHGGPGGSCKNRHKGLYDPKRQRVIFHDQRGCGQSTPYGSLEHNTTQDLVEDIEKIAKHLKLDKFIVVGGSWGSTLAFAYGIKYPEHVAAMVLDGVLTLAKEEIEWLDQGRFQSFFPDVWQEYLDRTPPAHRSNPSAYHFKRILGNDPLAAKESGYAYECLEGDLIWLDNRMEHENFDDYEPDGIRLEVHYLANHVFLPEEYIFKNVHKLTMPIYLIPGRYDFVAPPYIAYKLHQKLPKSELIWTVSGHADERESWNVKRVLLQQLAGTE